MTDRRVLVADDDPALSRMLKTLVASWGHEPIVVTDGEAALAALSGSTPVPRALIDWMMPGLTGLDVVREHRRSGGQTHIVMLTARDRSEDVVAGLEAGADDYLVKPFDHAELRARLMRGVSAPPDAPAELVPLESGVVIAGRYRLEYMIGEGGMGSVWRASHVELGHAVAIKLIRPAYAASPLARARFEREARTASQLRSSYLAQIFDYGVTAEGLPYLVMEYLVGHNLVQTIESGGPLSLASVAILASQVARGLDVAHAAGVVHRDVKPENVFLEDIGDDSVIGLPYRAKLLDFGIARFADETRPRVTTERGFVGTLGYASPEQVSGDSLDAASDLWSFGATMCFALTGEPPIPDATHVTMMMQTFAGELQKPTDLMPGLPAAVDAWAARACAVDPAKRFPDPLSMARELRAIAGLANARASTIPAPRATVTSEIVTTPEGVALPRALAAADAPSTRPWARMLRWLLVLALVVSVGVVIGGAVARSAASAQPTNVSLLVP